MGNDPFWTFLPLILLVVVFYFLLIRPQRKRQQEMIQMQNSLVPGTRVMTTTGLFGTVVGFEGDDVLLEVAPGVQTRWLKAAIGRVVPPTEEVSGAGAPAVDASDTGSDDDTSSKQS